MKALFGLVFLFAGIALAYGGTFATFFYGVVLMIKEGFLYGLAVSTMGALCVFGIGIVMAGSGKAMLED